MRRQYGYDGTRFVAYWCFVGWDCISLGLHVCWSRPNIELHLPFGFFRVGMQDRQVRDFMINRP